ncbi:leucine-rich repeat neuronal protein 2-like [Nylanderia fulva]|uniref:leucine-rich repeat neuronal protein 2-like n=1 Tax=Nylanderia fulva TaxID=613905 RepID=UPI0010FB24AB|nr:leucine-rich repeat neuronal protein 2-like [Nylanderia fulva]
MDLRKSIPLLALFLLAKCENGTEDAITDSNAINSENTSPESAILCNVCACTDGYVNCSGRALQNHFEDSQWSNVTAKEISFERNRLVHLTPFPKIIVEKIILRKNQISTIDRRAFKELVNLTELDLSSNQLTSERLGPHIFEGQFSPEAYEPLPLKILNLSFNILQWLHQSIFEHMVSIEVLDLSGNPFGVFDYRTSIAITSLSYLQELNLSYCKLKELPNLQFHNARHLKKLSLAVNEFTNLPRSLEEAEVLEYLNLDGNPIRVINNANAFPNLTKLRELSLCNMPNLTTIGNGGLSGLIGLEDLRVRNCKKLEVIEEYSIAVTTTRGMVWPMLKKLDLSSNAIQYLPSLLLDRWDKLEELHLMHNRWSCDCQNQYLVTTILPEYAEKKKTKVEELTCSAPPEHAGKSLASLADRHLRCLDLYDARPEKDAAILVGMLIGLLIAIPVGMALFAFWRRGFFFCGSQGPASFSRAFYKRASNDDDI